MSALSKISKIMYFNTLFYKEIISRASIETSLVSFLKVCSLKTLLRFS